MLASFKFPNIRITRLSPKDKVIDLLKHADIEVNGVRPWDIQVHDERFYDCAMSQANLGAGESYINGWWDCQALDQMFDRILRVRLDQHIQPLWLLPHVIKGKLVNTQSKRFSKKVAEQHYDAGNDLFQVMLDKNMQYTCGYWEKAENLDKAQEAKLELICKKLLLQNGMKVLELGGGFGGLARYMAAKYGCHVTSYNISKEQVAFGRAWCKNLLVAFIEIDYRDAKKLPTGSFDRVVSVGLLEHVGYKNYKEFFEIIAHALKEGGLALVHSIGSNETVCCTDAWIDKYIFPHGHLPSIKQLGEAMEKLMVMEDWHNFGADYDKTLMAWDAQFTKGWPELKDKYDQRFYRMWRYHLLSCAGVFRARQMQLWQLVLTKYGAASGYRRPIL